MATGKSEPEAPLRLGLFGGTFNPMHYGHLRSAAEVCEALALTRLWFIPTGHPPHKTAPGITPFEVRLEMSRLAVGNHPVMSVSDLEGRRPGRSYSIETLRQIRREVGPACELYFILGLDAILEIATWKDYKDLFTLSHFVVLDRPGYNPRRLKEVLLGEVHPLFRPLKTERGFQHPSGHKVILQKTTLMDISGTAIREMVRHGRSIRYLLPEAVREYIITHKLYL
jgi:nicotinate-nucleotide adenylyltransferase